MKVLLVEDARALAEALAEVLRKSGHVCDLTFDGATGLDRALSGSYDAAVLDIMLPCLDGISVLRRLRSAGVQTPVLLLTARSEVADRVRGLDAGADDYLTKPFHAAELLARLRALHRRPPETAQPGVTRAGSLLLDAGSLELSCGGRRVTLSAKEAQLFELLALRVGATVPKRAIMERLWSWGAVVGENRVEVLVSALRRKLAEVGASDAVATVRGVGYALRPPAGEGPMGGSESPAEGRPPDDPRLPADPHSPADPCPPADPHSPADPRPPAPSAPLATSSMGGR